MKRERVERSLWPNSSNRGSVKRNTELESWEAKVHVGCGMPYCVEINRAGSTPGFVTYLN